MPRLIPTLPFRRQSGATMIEVLVTIFILSYGLLGLAGMLMHIMNAEMESYQRSQALILASDMAERIIANRANITTTNYSSAALDRSSSTTLGKDDSRTTCAALTGYDLDLCEWSLLLKGSAETSGGNKTGAMIDARGCITRTQSPNATSGICKPDVYRIDVVWQGLAPTTAPQIDCGQGDYGDDANRRAVSRVVTIGLADCS